MPNSMFNRALHGTALIGRTYCLFVAKEIYHTKYFCQKILTKGKNFNGINPRWVAELWSYLSRHHSFENRDHMRQTKSAGSSWWVGSKRVSSHSFVHSLEPSDQGPSQPASPHGSRSTTNCFPLISTALTIECERLPTRPSTVAFFTPLWFASRVLTQHPKRRSWLALTSSLCQNLSRSKMSWEKVSGLTEKNKKAKANVPRLGSD